MPSTNILVRGASGVDEAIGRAFGPVISTLAAITGSAGPVPSSSA